MYKGTPKRNVEKEVFDMIDVYVLYGIVIFNLVLTLVLIFAISEVNKTLRLLINHIENEIENQGG